MLKFWVGAALLCFVSANDEDFSLGSVSAVSLQKQLAVLFRAVLTSEGALAFAERWTTCLHRAAQAEAYEAVLRPLFQALESHAPIELVVAPGSENQPCGLQPKPSLGRLDGDLSSRSTQLHQHFATALKFIREEIGAALAIPALPGILEWEAAQADAVSRNLFHSHFGVPRLQQYLVWLQDVLDRTTEMLPKLRFRISMPLTFQSHMILKGFHRTAEQLPAFVLANVCIRDLSSQTRFVFDTDHQSLPGGHRLELLTVGLSQSQRTLLDRSLPYSSRFFHTALDSSEALGDVLGGSAPVRHVSGLAFFLYNGHSSSTRCPICSNVAHHLVDDLLIDLAAWHHWRNQIHEPLVHVVTNCLATLGDLGPKRWFAEVLMAIAEHLKPQRGQIEMQRDETFCFDTVAVGMASSFGSLSAFGRRGEFQHSRKLAPVVQHMRAAVSSFFSLPAEGAHGTAPVCPASCVAYGRPHAVGLKSRKWLNLHEVVDFLRASTSLSVDTIDFSGLTVAGAARRLASADSVMMPSGAAIANVLFARRGTLWMEPLRTNVTDRLAWLSPAWRGSTGARAGGLASAFGVRFVSLEVDGGASPNPKTTYPRWRIVRRGRAASRLGSSTLRVPAFCRWQLEVRGHDLEDTAAPKRAFPNREAAQEACGALADACGAVRMQGGQWTLRRGALVQGPDASAVLVRKRSCQPIRQRVSWNMTQGLACADADGGGQLCTASVNECRSRCESVPWCLAATCNGGDMDCPCDCRLCQDLRKSEASTQFWMRSEVFETQTPAWLDYHAYNDDIVVNPVRVLKVFFDLGCDLLSVKAISQLL